MIVSGTCNIVIVSIQYMLDVDVNAFWFIYLRYPDIVPASITCFHVEVTLSLLKMLLSI